MPSLTELRHDTIDDKEDLRERAVDLVNEVRAEVLSIASESADFDDILEEIALRVENKLAGLTTDAARIGAFHGIRIGAQKRGV